MSSVLQRATDAVACQMLNNIASASTQYAAWALYTGAGVTVPLTVGGLSYMANQLLCQDMDWEDKDNNDRINGCKRIANGYGVIYGDFGTDEWQVSSPGASDVVALAKIYNMHQRGNLWGWDIDYINTNGEQVTTTAFNTSSKELAERQQFKLVPITGECAESVDPDDDGDPNPDFEPYQYNDPVTNCNYTLKLQGFVQPIPDGAIQPVYEISSSGDSQRASGGRMGGCNLSPQIIIGGNGDGTNPPTPIPVPPNPIPGPNGQPWWLGPLLGAVTGSLLNQLGRLMNDTFNYPMNTAGFQLLAPCDTDGEGNALYRNWGFAEEPLILRLHSHQVAMMEMIQQHLSWKTPTCSDNSNEKPPLEGEWVTTRWQSVETMPHSGHRLRKQFRYRSKSGLPIQERSAYWEWFQWESGDVCVIHKGAWWGTPQVWASSEEEGKRVIRFAAGEAGLDPDQTGEWKVSRSSSPRYGMSGTMKIQLYKGFPWISSRGGASYPNTLAQVHDP